MRRLLSPFLALLLLAVPFTTAAATDDFEYGNRKDMDTVALDIKGIHRDLGTWNITVETLRADLSKRLAASGVRVIDISELASHPGADVITLRLTLNRAPYYFYLYGLNMSMRNRLSLSPEGSGSTTIKTWSETQNGMLMPSDLGNIHRMSLQLLDNLLREHGEG
ncbi:MAG: hypothetical protein WD750_01540 [Gammaproteobacteria bacterium]